MAGQVVMQGFIRRRIPIFLRRAITLAPALVVLGIGFDPTDALVASQVVLSFGIPFALVPLLMIAAKREVMGELVNPRWLTGVCRGVGGDDHCAERVPASAGFLRVIRGGVGAPRGRARGLGSSPQRGVNSLRVRGEEHDAAPGRDPSALLSGTAIPWKG